MTINILGPSDDAKDKLRADFAMSSADWSQRAREATLRGDTEKARVFSLVARVADQVSKSGLP